MKTFPPWAILSLAANACLLFLIVELVREPSQQRRILNLPLTIQARASTPTTKEIQPQPQTLPELGIRHQLTYEQWVKLLSQEAEVVAEKSPERLAILAGDSLSLWFPVDLLPPERIWLNQGISGETSEGLLRRLSVFDRTQPETILVMIGINDLIRGLTDAEILENQRRIIQDLQIVHPQAQIIVQSILPHRGMGATWEGRDRLLKISNQRIRLLNEQLRGIASETGATYLDLYPLFTDERGEMRTNLSTDGLHLSREGYLVWRAALQLYFHLEQ